MVDCSGHLRTFRVRSRLAMAWPFLLILLIDLSQCQQASIVRRIRPTPIDTVEIEETESSVISWISHVVRYGDKEVIVCWDDPGVAIRSHATGKILFEYTLPMDITDSINPIEMDSLRPKPGCFMRNGEQLYGASRERLSIEEQIQNIRHELKHASFSNDSVIVLTCVISGVFCHRSDGDFKYSVAGDLALVFVNFVQSKLFHVIPLPIWRRDYNFSSTQSTNIDGSLVLCGANAWSWLDRRGGHRGKTVCMYEVSSGAMQLFAERDTGVIRPSGVLVANEFPKFLWRDRTHFIYANGSDAGAYGNGDELKYRLPDSDSDTASIASRTIAGLSETEELFGIYCMIDPNRARLHRMYVYDKRSAALLCAVDVESGGESVLHCMLDDTGVLSVYRKEERIRRIRYLLPDVRSARQ
jgi:hypothetical protein